MRFELQGLPAYAYTGTRPLQSGRPAIVFLHGAENDHSVWTLPTRYFAHHGWNAVAPDLPGHGRSGGPPLTRVEALADWLVALLDQLGIAQAVVAGHSLGSLITLDAAARYPERIAKLALLGPAVPMTVSELLLTQARDDPPMARRMINGWSYAPAAQLGGNRVPGVWMTGTALALMDRMPPGTLLTDLLACHQYTAGLERAVAVSQPVLLILGERDQMAPPRAAKALAAALADVRSVTLPGCGHSMLAEAPDATLDALRDLAIGRKK